MNGKRFSNEKARRNGFYLALAVCLVAVGVAAWSTYDAVNGVVEPAYTDPGSSQLWEQQAEDVRSGQEEGAVEDQDPEEPAAAQEASPAPTPTPDAKETAGTAVSITLILAAALLTGLGQFDTLAKHAGAGTLVPITGFANAVASPAIDFRSEGFVTGMAARMFTVAGPVIVYGVIASAVYGVILCLW